ncbi:hypothetical protein SAMN05216486_10123 [bacterium JGI 053]|nr:hypothetical protein SAMN05216486_10123 [bacterium JGI 053]
MRRRADRIARTCVQARLGAAERGAELVAGRSRMGERTSSPADQALVLVVTADPEPRYVVILPNPQRTVMDSNAHGAERSNVFEVE